MTSGMTYDEERDGARLHAQLGKVFGLMADTRWRTLEQIAKATGYPQASVSARLRDLRKPRYGGHQVEREYIKNGLWMYRVTVKGS